MNDCFLFSCSSVRIIFQDFLTIVQPKGLLTVRMKKLDWLEVQLNLTIRWTTKMFSFLSPQFRLDWIIFNWVEWWLPFYPPDFPRVLFISHTIFHLYCTRQSNVIFFHKIVKTLFRKLLWEHSYSLIAIHINRNKPIKLILCKVYLIFVMKN